MNSNDNYIALTSKNIQNNYLDMNEYITIDKMVADKYLKRSKLYVNDVILSYTGEYRRALKLYDNGFQLGPNVCRIRPKSKCNIKSGFLSLFLNSEIGQKILDKEKTLSAQPTVAMSRIRSIPVPKFSNDFQEKIEKIVDKYYLMKEESKKIYEETEKEFISIINYSNIEKFKNYNIKSLSSSMKANSRLDAEYYKQEYENYNNIIKSYNGKEITIGDICIIFDKNYIPNNDMRYKYIELANINNNGDILDVTEQVGGELPTRARRLVKKGQVIVSSIEGSLNSCAIVDDEFDGAICSSGFFVITSDKISSECLLIILKSQIMQYLLKQQCTGTILTCINKEDFRKIQIPVLDKKSQDIISAKVRESFELRKKSKEYLEKAQNAIKIAIEENEDVANKYLKSIVERDKNE